MGGNIYSEMLNNIAVPERLSPENIAKMLEEKAPERCKRAQITVSQSSYQQAPKKKSANITAAYRAIASLAACAVMAFGIYSVLGRQPEIASSNGDASSYAQDYDELHQTFRKYFVNENKDTLDSVLEEIEHSYNDNQQESSSVKVDAPTTSATEETPEVSEPVVTEPPVTDVPTVDPEIEVAPENSNVQEAIISDGRIFIQNGNGIRVILANGGSLAYFTEILPEVADFETKTLEAFFVDGSKLIAVYSVTQHEETITVTEDETLVGELINSIYDNNATSAIAKSTEICVYEFVGDAVVKTACNSQSGSLVDARLVNGVLYIVTSYNNYQNAPTTGVDDLQSYVPYYTENGELKFVAPENILIPSNVATTDYTVISGTDILSGAVSVQAVLGSEGKVIVTDTAVYVFSYGNKSTTINKLSLFGGWVGFAGTASVNGVALNGGIFEENGVLFVATLVESESGFVTSVEALNADMQPISKLNFPSALTSISHSERKVYLSNVSAAYGIDFTVPEIPTLISAVPEQKASETVPFGNGYVTLVKDASGALVLGTMVPGEQGLTPGFGTVVYNGEATSKALENNSLLFVDSYNGFVGVPYGFFDGYDYCYRFAMYQITENGFVLMGCVESHETESVFEPERAVFEGGVLYLFSQGRIYSLAVNGGVPTVMSVCNLVESSYSGHTNW